MNELKIFARESHRTPGFWERQFSRESTRAQSIFDVLLGMIGPVLCFAFDPFVFKGGIFGPPFYPQYQLFVYAFSALEIAVLGLWLASGATGRFPKQLAGGILLWGGIMSAAVGLILLPFSVIGLALGIGLFGFTPFLTAIVYLRNGVRAWHSDAEKTSIHLRATAVLASLLIIGGLPFLMSYSVHVFAASSVTEIVTADSRHAVAAAQRLRPMSLFADYELERLIQAYAAEPDPGRKELLKTCYQEATGKDIEVVLTMRD